MMNTRTKLDTLSMGGRVFLILHLTTLAACATSPSAHPILDTPAPASSLPRIVDAHGALSVSKRKALIANLSEEVERTAILSKHIALEEKAAGTPLVAGNTATLLRDGRETYAAMFEAIRDARDHVNMETYIFQDDDAGNKFADLLIQKQRQGVQVNLIFDSIGSLETSKQFFEKLRNEGIQVLEFNPVNPLAGRAQWNINNRDHRKLTIVDGKIAFTGGINISDVYSSGSSGVGRESADSDAENVPWRDTQIQIEGPVVAQFQHLFIQTWEKQHGPPLIGARYFPKLSNEGDFLIHAIGSSPDLPSDLMFTTLLSAISSAEHSIYLTNAYFAPTTEVLDALKSAARRGVDVQLLLPGLSDNWLPLYAGRRHYSGLLDAGVKIFQRKHALLHAKSAVIDGVWSSIGSTNLDWRSTVFNDEIDAVIVSDHFADQMEAAFSADKRASEEVTKSAWDDRSLLSRLKEWLAGIFERWL